MESTHSIFYRRTLSQSVFPNRPPLSMCTWGTAEIWMWTAGRSGWSWPEAPHRRRAQRRVACCGWRTTSRASRWRATAPVGLKVTRDDATAYKVTLKPLADYLDWPKVNGPPLFILDWLIDCLRSFIEHKYQTASLFSASQICELNTFQLCWVI